MNKTKASRRGKTVIEATQAKEDPAAGSAEVPPTKAATIIALLREPSGGTLKAIMAATGWQSHSVRGFISAQLVKKRKLKVKSFKRNGERVYKIPR
jgi:nicotinamidase-related amidase